MFNTDFTYLKSVEMAPELATAWGHSQALKWQHKALQHAAEALLGSRLCSLSRQGCVSDKSLLLPANFYHLFDVFILYGGHGGAAPSLGPGSKPFVPVLLRATPLSLLQAAAIIPNQCPLLSCQCREYFI